MQTVAVDGVATVLGVPRVGRQDATSGFPVFDRPPPDRDAIAAFQTAMAEPLADNAAVVAAFDKAVRTFAAAMEAAGRIASPDMPSTGEAAVRQPATACFPEVPETPLAAGEPPRPARSFGGVVASAKVEVPSGADMASKPAGPGESSPSGAVAPKAEVATPAVADYDLPDVIDDTQSKQVVAPHHQAPSADASFP